MRHELASDTTAGLSPVNGDTRSRIQIGPEGPERFIHRTRQVSVGETRWHRPFETWLLLMLFPSLPAHAPGYYKTDWFLIIRHDGPPRITHGQSAGFQKNISSSRSADHTSCVTLVRRLVANLPSPHTRKHDNVIMRMAALAQLRETPRCFNPTMQR